MQPTDPLHRIYIQPSTDGRTGLPKFGRSGSLYDVIYEGQLIVLSTSCPLLDACRVLLADGITGSIEMWDRIRPFPRMRAIIEVAAKLTVEEGEGTPRFRPYRNGFAMLGRLTKDGD